MNEFLIFVFISLIVFVGIVYCFVNRIKNIKKIDDFDVEYIEYSIGGGFGTEAQCATKTIKIKNDGIVAFVNSYNKDLIKEFKIDQEIVNDLFNYINENNSVLTTGVKTDEQAMDAGSQYIILKTKDEKEYKIGGYCVIDERFDEIATKIIETAGKEEFVKYCEEVRKSD